MRDNDAEAVFVLYELLNLEFRVLRKDLVHTAVLLRIEFFAQTLFAHQQHRVERTTVAGGHTDDHLRRGPNVLIDIYLVDILRGDFEYKNVAMSLEHRVAIKAGRDNVDDIEARFGLVEGHLRLVEQGVDSLLGGAAIEAIGRNNHQFESFARRARLARQGRGAAADKHSKSSRSDNYKRGYFFHIQIFIYIILYTNKLQK